jgi:hypothetical protein
LNITPTTAQWKSRKSLHWVVGLIAIIAPLLHTITDLIEWYQRGFSEVQLWLNYAAFLPMPWLLLGIYAVHGSNQISQFGLVGSLLYGAAFAYFLHTVLFALSEHVPTYEILWIRLGIIYTVHGALMVCGGLLFGWAVWCAGWLPRYAAMLFLFGIALNFILALLPVPDLFQAVGSAIRNMGLMAMGYSILAKNM